MTLRDLYALYNRTNIGMFSFAEKRVSDHAIAAH